MIFIPTSLAQLPTVDVAVVLRTGLVGSAFVRLAGETDPNDRAAAAEEYVRGLVAASR
jgi:hypothetical protein